ncbi:DnaJ domain-containing protein [Altererythrobacter sp. GH1-8]|uniref:DnaJ domain-containing protein n=1 Tax=Altererythrobacter sp. GH1-8 TaxID=3349333 RepID=UPI00374D24A2
MEGDQEFVDYYELLQVTPSCPVDILSKAYRHLASKYHPDHPETADRDKFQKITEGYAILRDPEKRASYDRDHRVKANASFYKIPSREEIEAGSQSAIQDADTHENILFFLYKRRREHAAQPGVIAYYVQEMIGCCDESFEFHVWYLKSKGFVEVTEQGTLAITIEGVDHVISHSRSSAAAKLLNAPLARSGTPLGEMDQQDAAR